MTALQEAPDIADIIAGALQVSRGTAYDLMRTALAQQEADKPFQPDWVNYRQGVEDGKAEALLAQQGEQQVCAGCGIPVGDVHMSTCKSGKWPSRVSNGNTTAPQAHPSRDVTELVEALEDLSKACAWINFGDCRAINDRPIMDMNDAYKRAYTTLAKHKGAK